VTPDRDRVVPDVADSYALLDDGQVCAEVEPLDDWDNPQVEAMRRRYRRLEHGDRPRRT
jgi:hypothetical protein